MLSNVTWIEVALTVSACVLLIGYHVALVARVKRKPLSTSLGTNNQRIEWVRNVMNNGRDILAVQTLRNLTMAATFLASTSILVALALMSYAFTSEYLQHFSHALNRLGSHHPELVTPRFSASHWPYATATMQPLSSISRLSVSRKYRFTALGL